MATDKELAQAELERRGVDPFYVLGNSPLVETLLQGATGVIGQLAGGLGGFAMLPYGPDAVKQAYEKTSEALTYQPRSQQAQQFGQRAGEVLSPVEQGKQWLGDKTLEATGSPALATGAYMTPELLEAAAALFGVRSAVGGGDIGGQATGVGRREIGAVGGGKPKRGYKRLYRGMESEFDPRYDLTRTDAPSGYSTWTDNPDLAKQYAGESGHIYYIDLPESMQGVDLIDEHGERPLFLNNEKPAGLFGVSGDEYLLYVDHDDYNPSDIKLLDAEG